MTAAADGGGGTGPRRRIPPAAWGALVAVLAAGGLAANALRQDAAGARAIAEERRREQERNAAMVREVVAREMGRPAPASGVRLLPRCVVRTGDDRTLGVRAVGWSPGGERFAIARQYRVPFHGFRRDPVLETVEIRDLDGALLREVPLPPLRRGALEDRDALFALTTTGYAVVAGGEVRLADLDGRETGRLAASSGGPVVGVHADAAGRVLAWTGSAVVLDRGDGRGTRTLPVDLWGAGHAVVGLVPSFSGGKAVVLAGTQGLLWSEAWVLDLDTGSAARLLAQGRGNSPVTSPRRVAWLPGPDERLAVGDSSSVKSPGFELAGADGLSRAKVPSLLDVGPLADGSAFAGHGVDGALRLFDRDGKETFSVPGALDPRWFRWNWWREVPRSVVTPRKGTCFATLRNADGEFVRLWSAAGAPLARDPLPGRVVSARFSPDGTRILVAYASGSLAVLEIVRR